MYLNPGIALENIKQVTEVIKMNISINVMRLDLGPFHHNRKMERARARGW